MAGVRLKGMKTMTTTLLTETTTYGLHLTLRIARIERPEALDDDRGVGDFLKALVDRIGMRILAGPLVGREEGGPDKRGCSGVVILYESHAALHTYPELGEAFVDIFSCKEFSVDTVREMLTGFVGRFEIVEEKQFPRGIHWGCNIDREMNAWLGTR